MNHLFKSKLYDRLKTFKYLERRKSDKKSAAICAGKRLKQLSGISNLFEICGKSLQIPQKYKKRKKLQISPSENSLNVLE